MQITKIYRTVLTVIFVLGVSQASAVPLTQQALGKFTNITITSCGSFCNDWSLEYSGSSTLYDAYWYTAKVGTSSRGDNYTWSDSSGAWEFGGTSGTPSGDYGIGLDYSLIDTSLFGGTNGADASSKLPAIALGDLNPGDSFSFRSEYTVSGSANGFFATSYVVGADEPGQIAAVPEPGTLPLMALGLAGLGFAVRKRRGASEEAV